MSTQQEPVRQGGGPDRGGGAAPGTSKVFRLPGPIVLWWVWVVFAAVNLVDLAVQGHDRTSAQVAIALLAITGLVYACALRPRVVTDTDGITLLNPIRDYRAPWGRVSDI